MPGVLPEEIDLPGAMTVAEAADELGVSTKSIFRLVQRGRLHVVGRAGRSLLVASTATAYLPPAAKSPLAAPYTANRSGELCTITHSGPDMVVVTTTGPRAARVLETVAPAEVRHGDAMSGWLIPSGLVPLLHAAQRLRGVHVELMAA